MKLRWLRILIAAFVAEVALIVIAIPLNLTPGGRTALVYVVVPMCLVATYVGGWWAARAASSRFVLHGLLVGVLAALLYGALTVRTPLPWIYVVANFLKLVGGAAGGLAAQRAAARAAAKPAAA